MSHPGTGLTDREFLQFSELIEKECGIHLPLTKKTLLEGRLLKRMKVLQLPSYGAYLQFVFSAEGLQEELSHMIDVVTTNKTDFFREADHFDFLTRTVLPLLKSERPVHDRRRYLFWSAGCSSGEEPYTLSMVLTDYKEKNPGFDFLILATDISSIKLEQAQRGIYEERLVEPVPMAMKKRFLLRSKDRSSKQVRIAPEIRQRVKFAWLNFMEEFPIHDHFDVIFCRNVIIYFTREDQAKLMERFSRQLNPGGFLFLGHSETLTAKDLPFKLVAPTVYRKL